MKPSKKHDLICKLLGFALVAALALTPMAVSAAEQQTPNDSIIPPNYPGHFSDYIDLSEFEVIQNDYVKIFVPQKYEFAPNITETVMQSMEWVEKATGISELTRRKNVASDYFLSQEELEQMDSVLQYLNVFNEMARFDNKIYIYPYDGTAGTSEENAMTIAGEYLAIDTHDGYGFGVLLHEFAHMNQMRYAEYNYPPIQEGYAVWVTCEVAKKQGLENLYSLNNDYYLPETLPGNLEDYFAGGYTDDQLSSDGSSNENHYRYGYALCLYLEEVYGTQIFAKIFSSFDAGHMYQYIPVLDPNSPVDMDVQFREYEKAKAKFYVESIKAVTSQGVFADCIAWFHGNGGKE